MAEIAGGHEAAKRLHQRARSSRRLLRAALLTACVLAGLAAEGLAFLSAPSAAETASHAARSTEATGRREVLSAVSAGVLGAEVLGNAGEAEAMPIGPPQKERANRAKLNSDGFVIANMVAFRKKVLGFSIDVDNKCFQLTGEGRTIKITAPLTVVWDPDLCDDGKAFIHAAGEDKFIPMFAESGPTKHTMHLASTFNAEDYISQVGKCAETPDNIVEDGEVVFQIANQDRGGSCA